MKVSVLQNEIAHIKLCYENDKFFDGSILDEKDYIKFCYGNKITFIAPVFNRDGFYYDRLKKFAWVEVFDLAFTHHIMVSQFKYFLSLLNHKRISDKEMDAMKFLLSLDTFDNSVSRVMRDRIRIEEEIRYLRKLRLGIK